MTAPNTETTNLSRNLGDGNPDAMLSQGQRITAMANANATLTAAQMVNAIITMTHDANYTLTTDTYANIANAVGSGFGNANSTVRTVPANTFFDMTILANGATANTLITLAAGTGVNLLGNMVAGQVVATPATKSASYRCVFNANSTITIYRL